jgi:hypothetical protein
MWSIPLRYCNNGNNNSRFNQTELRYYIKHNISGGYMFRLQDGILEAEKCSHPNSAFNIILGLFF